LSVKSKNKAKLTARQHAQKEDRFKFHRVIKYLRELEEKEANISTLLKEEEEGNVKYADEVDMETLLEFMEFTIKNKGASLIICVVMALFLFGVYKSFETDQKPYRNI